MKRRGAISQILSTLIISLLKFALLRRPSLRFRNYMPRDKKLKKHCLPLSEAPQLVTKLLEDILEDVKSADQNAQVSLLPSLFRPYHILSPLHYSQFTRVRFSVLCASSSLTHTVRGGLAGNHRFRSALGLHIPSRIKSSDLVGTG